MQMQMECESDNQLELISFIYDALGDEKLIDINKEDDDLLSYSPLFDSLEDLRPSVTFVHTIEHEGFKGSEFLPSQEVENTVEKLLQKEQKLSSCHDFVPARPIYLRKSLPWDNAFFTSAGVLDNDELAFVNEGFKTAEMQLPPDTCKQNAFSPASMNINIGIQNKTKTSASQGKNINNQRSVKNKTEHISKGEESFSLPLKAPKVFRRMKNVLMGHSKSASVDYHASVVNKTSTIRSDHQETALEESCSLSSGSLSFSEYSPVIVSSANNSTVSSSSRDRKASASSTKVPSALLERKTESRKSKLSDSTSSSDAAVRYLVKGKGLEHPRFSTQSLSLSNKFSCISSSSSFKGSSSGPKSRAKQQSNDTEIHLDAPVTLTRTISQDEVNRSPHLTNILHRKSTLRLQNEETSSSVQWSKQGLTDTSHVPTEESRKKLKPSYLRMPSPKIGFFDEEKSMMPTMGRSLQFHFDMQCTPPSKSGSSNWKTPGKILQARTSSETKCMKPGSRSTRLLPAQDIIKLQHVASNEKLKSSFPQNGSTMKCVSDVGLRFRSGACEKVKEEITSKCRKVGAGECNRKRVGQNPLLRRADERRRVKGSMISRSRSSREANGQITNPIIRPELSNGCKQHNNANNLHSSVEDKARTLANFKDQVNDLSKHFEVIDLSRNMVTKNKENEKDCCLSQVDNITSKFNDDNIVAFAHDQKQDVLPNTFTDSSPPSISRTPLADKTSISNTSGSLIQSTTKDKLAEKPSIYPCPEGPPYKENTLAPYEL